GLGTCPPLYPEETFFTPSSCSKIASVHQKHPVPKVAVSVFLLVIFSEKFSDIVIVFSFDSLQAGIAGKNKRESIAEKLITKRFSFIFQISRNIHPLQC